MLSREPALKTEAVRLGPGLTIYKQPKAAGRGSPFWYARVNLEVGGRKVHTKSTGTTDPQHACAMAQDFFAELLVQKKGGIVPEGRLSDRAYRFDIIADAWLDDLKQSAGNDDRKLRRYRDHRKIVSAPNGLTAFLARRDIRTITTKLISDYLDFAERGSKAEVFKPTTKRNHLATLSKLLNWAVDAGLLDRLPRLPTIRMKDSPRPAFEYWEYQLLLSACRATVRYYRLCGDDAAADRWQELLDFITFVVDSFLRPGEETVGLQQKHIEIVEGEHCYLKISVVRGKTGRRKTVTMPGAVETYRRILKRQGADPERYLFMPQYLNRNTAKERLGDRFNELLDLTGLALDPEGRKRTLYSLRHTALTQRILNGDDVELLTLARAAGTSVRMLDRFYCSGLEAERNIGNLQSFKVPPEPKDEVATQPPTELQKFVQANSILTD